MKENNRDITITDIQNVKTITKPWGYEKLIADGSPDFKYALKEIKIRSTFSSSIQFHEFKQETTYVKSGNGWLYYNEEPIDLELYKQGKYSKVDLENIIKNMKKFRLEPGVIYHIKPRVIHRVESEKDLIFIESSTVELDDVYRLNDQWGRLDGKIDKEHLEYLEVIKNDLFNEQKSRYDFAKKYAVGKVLDVTIGKFMSYHGSHMLLENDANEVWNYDFLDNKTTYYIRKFNEDHSINFEKRDEINDIKFDTILCNQTIQYEKEPEKTIEKFDNLLTDKGILIISTYNLENKFYKNKKTDQSKINGFSKDDFHDLLSNYFQNVEIFSQRNINIVDTIGKNTKEISFIKDEVRSSLGKILLKFDKKSIFYKKYLQDSITRIGKSMEKISEGIHDEDYIPTKFKNGDNPLFFIAICKK